MNKKDYLLETRDQKILIKHKCFLYFFIKAFFDIFVSFISIIIFLPLMIIIFLVNLFITKGHPVFLDKRIGKKGKVINVIKYRTMYYDAESNIDKYLSSEQKEEWMKNRKLSDDPRITKFGNILRKSSLDELPQLFNIFVLSMSFVGPRPMSKREVDNEFSEEERRVLFDARPGLTGYWQTHGRNNAQFDNGRRQLLELEYFSKRNLLFDLGIIFKTIGVVIKRDGAK